MPLSPLEEEQIVQRVGSSDQVRSHLKNLGFVPGTPVSVVSTLGGSLIVRIRDTRIAVSRELANRIIV